MTILLRVLSIVRSRAGLAVLAWLVRLVVSRVGRAAASPKPDVARISATDAARKGGASEPVGGP